MSVIILLFPAIAISVLYTRAQSSVIDFYSGWPWASLSLSLSEAAGLIRPRDSHRRQTANPLQAGENQALERPMLYPAI